MSRALTASLAEKSPIPLAFTALASPHDRERTRIAGFDSTSQKTPLLRLAN